MAGTRPEGALLAISAQGLASMTAIIDDLAKNLGLPAPSLTTERGGGRFVALWSCTADIACEARSAVARLPNGPDPQRDVHIILRISDDLVAFFGGAPEKGIFT